MSQKKFKDILLIILALVFSIALMFSFIELQSVIDAVLQENVSFLGFYQGANELNTYKTDLYILELHFFL